jgi:D-3-phosphoglycerate dehydrogenase
MKNKIEKKINILITWRLLIENLNKYIFIFKKNRIRFDVIKCDQHLKEKKLIDIIHKYDGIICGDDELTKKVLKRAKRLKIISKWGTGIDSIDKDYAKQKGIILKNSPGAFSKSVSQHAIGLIFSILRNIVCNHNDIIKGNWSKRINSTIDGKTIGIIGYGNIGKEIYEKLSVFDVNFLFNDKKKISKKNTSLNTLLKKSDIVIISCDLNKTSYHLLKYSNLKLMKKSSIIINVSRGAIVKSSDLLIILKQKKISGAGLDVFEEEPLKKNNPLTKLKNCILTSHNAFNDKNLIDKINLMSVQNIIKYFKN